MHIAIFVAAIALWGCTPEAGDNGGGTSGGADGTGGTAGTAGGTSGAGGGMAGTAGGTSGAGGGMAGAGGSMAGAGGGTGGTAGMSGGLGGEGGNVGGGGDVGIGGGEAGPCADADGDGECDLAEADRRHIGEACETAEGVGYCVSENAGFGDGERWCTGELVAESCDGSADIKCCIGHVCASFEGAQGLCVPSHLCFEGFPSLSDDCPASPFVACCTEE